MSDKLQNRPFTSRPTGPQREVAAALMTALETMAFVTSEAAAAGAADQAPAEPLLVSMDFRGPVSGRVELIASESFGRSLAANMIGARPDEPITSREGQDTLKELVNVTVGAAMPALATSATDDFALGMPTLTPFPAANWTDFGRRPGAMLFDAEGEIVAICLSVAA